MTRRTARAVMAAALVAAFGAGLVCGARRLFPYGPLRSAYRWLRPQPSPPAASAPRWFRVDAHPAALQREALAALPYTQGYRAPASAAAGVVVHEGAATWQGLNLIASAHATEAVLADMDGAPRHRWARTFEESFPGRALPNGTAGHERFWRRVELLPAGELLVVFETLGLVKLDRASRVMWTWDGAAHHDVAPLADGSLLVLAQEPIAVPSGAAAFDDFVVRLDAGGRPGRRVSLRRCFERSEYAPLLDHLPADGDLFHTNRLAVLGPGLPPPFVAGRALVSIRTLGAIALLDLEAERVTWALAGLWRGQHDPTPLPGPRLLVFDNWWGEGRSRVVEVDALTHEVRWQHPAPGQAPFFSAIGGTAQRLPNGNTLIVETTAGRAFEVDASGRTVWEYRSPHRAGDQRELVAALFQLTRLPRQAGDFLGH
jgi:hypothetical protein